MRGELTADKETQIIQSLIGKGLEREELRDEIIVQCCRQVSQYFFLLKQVRLHSSDFGRLHVTKGFGMGKFI